MVNLTYDTAVLFFLMFAVSGKLMQHGGILYAKGQRWERVTLCAAILLLIPIMAVLLIEISEIYATPPSAESAEGE